MKIAFPVDEFPRSSQPFIVNQITELYEWGCDVRIYATDHPSKNDWADILDGIEHNTTYTPIPKNKGKRTLRSIKLLSRCVRHDPLTTANVLNAVRFKKDALSLRPVFRLTPMLDEEFDIIHWHFGEKGRIGAILKQSGFDGKLVVSIHGHGLRLAKQNPDRYENLFSTVDCLLANSRYTFNQLRALGIDESRVIYQPVGIDPEDFPFKWRESVEAGLDKVNIITVARLENIKGIKYSLKSIWKLLQSTDLNLKYHLVGDGSQRGKFEDLTHQLDISDHVIFHSHQPRNEVISLLNKSDIFLLPSVEEAFGMVLLEAQAVGLPIVATRTGGIPEAVNKSDSAILVPAKDSDAIVSALRTLLESPDEWEEIGTAGRKYVEQNFDINHLNSRLVSIYENILK